MKVERWEDETDEDWAKRLAEEIAIANNTEISEYFVERDPYDEEGIIINYIGEGAWTWKEHPEGPFKAGQIIEWKNKAEHVPSFHEAWNKLCPQGWAWLIGDCDFGQNCGECKEKEAPIYAEHRKMRETEDNKRPKCGVYGVAKEYNTITAISTCPKCGWIWAWPKPQSSSGSAKK